MYSFSQFILEEKEILIMTFHTFECRYQLGGNEFAAIHRELKNLGCSYYTDKNNDNDRKYICTALSKHGIMIYITIRKTTYNSFVPMLIYKINPTRMMEGNEDNYVDVFHCNNAVIIPQITNKLLKTISDKLPQIESCVLSRFDYCINIKLENEQQVVDSIKLINKAFDPTSDYMQKLILHTQSSKQKYPKTEATFRKHNRVEISFYNKRIQLLQENLNVKWHDNILRAEFRCFKQYITDLYKRFDINTITDFFEKSIDIGHYVISHQLKKLRLNVIFCPLNSIENIIENTTFQKNTKLTMQLFAQDIAKHKSVKYVTDSYGHSIAKKFLKKFQKLHISPMPLHHRSSLPEPFNLENLIYRFADEKKCE